MVSRNDVEQAFRMLLGREPESRSVVDHFMATYGDVSELRRAFLASAEFQDNVLRDGTASAGSQLKSRDWAPISIEVDVEPDDLQAMLRHVELSWEKLGNTELFWSVLTEDKFRTSNLDANLEAFYESGSASVDFMLQALRRGGATIDAGMTCLELGCGAGRITKWLAGQFGNVIACDISKPHLAAARDAMRRYGITNVDFVRTYSVDVLRSLPRFDVFFSLIVLQHNPPPVAALLLRILLGKLNPGGVAYFQIPTHSVGYGFAAKRYLANAAQEMEMHVVPQKDLFALFASAGCDVLEVREDSWTGSPQILSNSFLLRKRDRGSAPP